MREGNNLKILEKNLIKQWDKADTNGRQKILNIAHHQISFLQHERLIHLLVTLFFGGASIFTGWISLNSINLYFLIIFFAILITELFYIFHYYYLENTCQHWQNIAIKLESGFINNTNTKQK
jgi:hypothetical protein